MFPYYQSVCSRDFLSPNKMNIVVCLVIMGVFAGSSSAANLTVTSATADYVALMNNNNQNDLKASRMRTECVEARGADAIRIIKDQQKETLEEIKRYEDSLVPMEALSLIRKHCIQKYKGMLVSMGTISTNFQTCIKTAQTRLDSLTVSAKSSQSTAEAYANVNLPDMINNCYKTNTNNASKLESCVVDNVTAYTNTIQTYLRNVEKSLDASLCTSTDLSRDAIQCSYKIEKSVLVTMGKVTSLIDNCVTQTETVCPCAKDLMVESQTPKSVRSLLTEYRPKNETNTLTQSINSIK
ncbi:uncharacterized protein LOC129946076 [Eupeodes corollae]|uniref:uncharacterized protein LOC129946076 n=1 Tax=Eupeodes corollae TaxID=290404 RepID=UPI0024922277|nr:uncharacterized protein LOC129946076 [Eupeodes corollae]